MKTEKFLHSYTGSVYTKEEILKGIESEELEKEGVETKEELFKVYLNENIFISIN